MAPVPLRYCRVRFVYSGVSTVNLRERQRRLREDMILDAAYDLIAGRGAGEVSMDDIAARAGVSKPTLYQHFASKDELVVRVGIRLMGQSQAALEARTADTPAVDHIVRVLTEGLTRRAGLWSARVAVPLPLAEADPAYLDQRARVQAALARLVDEAKAEGDIDARFPTPVVVRMLSRLFRGDYEDLLTAGVVTPEGLGEALIAIAFGGLRPRAARDAAPPVPALAAGVETIPARVRTA
jgi:AcrR family transcriptional regulator